MQLTNGLKRHAAEEANAKKLQDWQQNSNKQELFMSLETELQMYIGIVWRICHQIHVLMGESCQ